MLIGNGVGMGGIYSEIKNKNMQYTIAMSLGAVRMFCEGATIKSIQEQYGITEGSRLVRYGIRALVEKYNLPIQKDSESKIGFVVIKEDRDTLKQLAENEILIERPASQKTLDDLVSKPYLIEQIEALHNERILLKKYFDAINDRILNIERHVKSKNN